MLKCEIKYPDFEIQKRIASILSAIDEKIEANQRIAKNLENQCMYLLQSFIRRADDEWTNGYLKDLLTPIKESVEPNQYPECPYLPIDMMPVHSLLLTEVAPNAEAKTSLLRFLKDDILIGAMRVYFHRVLLSPFEGITRTTSFVLRARDEAYLMFSLLTCYLDSSIKFAQSSSKGSTMPYAVWEGGLGELALSIPPRNEAVLFNEKTLPLIRKIQSIYFENKSLASIRDSLLPKLMSGEIDVSDVHLDS